jgi:hypothetical protein
VTGWVQAIYYRLATRAGDPMPQPGTPRYQRHNRIIFVLVIVSYLLYTVYEVDWSVQREGDFYRDLGVPMDVQEKRLQSHFRKLCALLETLDPGLTKAAGRSTTTRTRYRTRRPSG